MNGKENDFLPIKSIEDDVGSGAEFDHPFSEFRWEVFEWTTDFRVAGEGFHAFALGFDGPLCSIGALGMERIMQPGNIAQGVQRPLQTWHSGASESSPFSNRASQASASSAVTCRPVAW